MPDQNFQSKHDSLTHKRKHSHYRKAHHGFWRGFFLGFFPSIHGDYDSQKHRKRENPFFEDQKRIGADMYNAIGVSFDEAKESER